ncbi:hypothetical protein C7212DRAFT_343412 [Tuber magnatum]|uniref:Uncharacterized protein n=1 Tax=Tuber magnatum TaxID=42249 RepID=A0A317SRX7_9PEZI|nr:hypothetical protein C7212DRAFT_343412 [Tuber magnatum]
MHYGLVGYRFQPYQERQYSDSPLQAAEYASDRNKAYSTHSSNYAQYSARKKQQEQDDDLQSSETYSNRGTGDLVLYGEPTQHDEEEDTVSDYSGPDPCNCNPCGITCRLQRDLEPHHSMQIARKGPARRSTTRCERTESFEFHYKKHGGKTNVEEYGAIQESRAQDGSRTVRRREYRAARWKDGCTGAEGGYFKGRLTLME